jgi:hypothetical protein
MSVSWSMAEVLRGRGSLADRGLFEGRGGDLVGVGIGDGLGCLLLLRLEVGDNFGLVRP